MYIKTQGYRTSFPSGSYSGLAQVGLLLQRSRMSIHLLDDPLDPQVLAVEIHLFTILCRRKIQVVSMPYTLLGTVL